MKTGLVIGKFMPPHRGHAVLIRAAEAHCDELFVIVCDAGWHDVPAELRAEWVAETHPDVRTLVLDQDELGLADDDSEGWARATMDVIGRAPDLVFTSEDYGPRYAASMDAEHIRIDRSREPEGFNATAIRADPQAHLDWLDPPVRAHYVARVCVIGAESTGKTTLAMDLAEHYGVGFVGEFGRYYTEAMPEPARYRWQTADFRLIARAQAALEDDAARWTPAPLICDTNPFVTAVFHEAYLGRPDPDLEMAARARPYHLFVLCDLETPFEQDHTGLRHEGERRTWMHQRCRDYVESHGAAVVHAAGSREDRLNQATQAVDRVIGGRSVATERPEQDSNLRPTP
jgi:HTH-type transcriptional regulator, transcriptional repressor of NAD biosynthesis genes